MGLLSSSGLGPSLSGRRSLGLSRTSLGEVGRIGSHARMAEFDSPEDESIAMQMLSGGASALGYLGTSVFDAILGRRTRAALELIKTGGRKGSVSELFTVPVVSDLVGWTNPQDMTTGSDLTGWDDEDTILDGVAEFAVEVLTDPTTFMTGGATGLFGASTKAAKLLKNAGVYDDVVRKSAQGLSKKLGRKVGKRETAARLQLAKADVPLSGNRAADMAITKSLDDAAFGMGYKDFAEAQASDLGRQTLTAAWGFSKNPFASVPTHTIHGGEKFIKAQEYLDKAGNFISSTAMAGQFGKMFNRKYRSASTKEAQEEMARAYGEGERAVYRMKQRSLGDTQELQAYGLTEPEFINDLTDAAEGVYRSDPVAITRLFDNRGAEQMALPAFERDVKKIVDSIIDVRDKTGKFYPTGAAPRYGEYGQLVEDGVDVFDRPRKIVHVDEKLVAFEGDNRWYDIKKVVPMTEAGSSAKYSPTMAAPKAGEYGQFVENGVDLFDRPKKIDSVHGGYVVFEGDRAQYDIGKVVPLSLDTGGKSKHALRMGAEQIAGAREAMYRYVINHAKHAAEVLEESHAVSIGPDKLNDLENNYLEHVVAHIPEATGRTRVNPKYVTPYMEAQLQSPRFGMTPEQISEQSAKEIAEHGDVRGLWSKVMGDRPDTIFTEKAAQEAKAPTVRPSSRSTESIANVDDPSHMMREEVRKTMPTSTLNLIAMDASVSGPNAGSFVRGADGTETWVPWSRSKRTEKIFREYMHGDTDLVKLWMDRKDKDLKPGSIARWEKAGKPNQLAVRYGVFAPPGKTADEIIETEADLIDLRQSLIVKENQYYKADDIAGVMEKVSPLHVAEQRPLMPYDPATAQMISGVGRLNAIATSAAVHRMFAKTATLGLVQDQAPDVLGAMQKAGISLADKKSGATGAHGQMANYLKNLVRIGKEEGVEEWEIFGKKMQADEVLRYLDPPDPEFVPKKIKGDDGKSVTNPEWVEHQKMTHRIKMQFGAQKSDLSIGLGQELQSKEYDRLKARFDATEGKTNPRTDREMVGVIAKLKEQAIKNTAKSKKKGGTIKKIINEVEQEFIALGAEPYRIKYAHVNDARGANDLVGNPHIMQQVSQFFDKLTSTVKGNLTSRFLNYFTRNAVTLGIMDLLTNADNILDPREMLEFYQRGVDTYRFHSGKHVNGINKWPMFHKVEWQKIENPEWRKRAKRNQDGYLRGPSDIPRYIDVPEEMKDKLLTDSMRVEFAASEVVSPGGEGELLRDVLAPDGSGLPSVDTLPGGKNNNARLAGAKAGIKRAFREAYEDAKAKGVNMRGFGAIVNNLSPFMTTAVRGGFGAGANKARSTNAFMRIGEGANNWTETIGRTMTWFGQLKKGVDPVEAAARSNAAHVDYGNLTEWEKKYARRAVGFYTYQRHMIPHLLNEMVKHPGGPLVQMVRAVNVASGERRENKFTPQQLQGQLAVPLYGSADGKLRAYIKPSLPVDVLNNLFTTGQDAYSTFQNTALGWLSNAHPVVRFMTDTAYGRSSFQKGRNLEDMYSRIGVKDPLTNQIVQLSPMSRDVTIASILMDDRKNLLEKFSSTALGMPIMHIDMDKATNEALDRALNKALSLEEGIGRADRFYAYDEELSPRAQALLKLKNTRSTRVMNEAKKKKAAQANERIGIVPPDSLMRLGH